MKLIVTLLLYLMPIFGLCQLSGNGITVNLFDKDNRPIIKARVFLSSLTQTKLFGNQVGKTNVFTFDSVPSGYTAVEVIASGYEPSGHFFQKETVKSYNIQLYRPYERRLQIYFDGAYRHAEIGREDDMFYRQNHNTIFVFRHLVVFPDTSFKAFIRRLGLTEVKKLSNEKSNYDVVFLRKKNGQDFERYNCPELYSIRKHDSSLVAGNIIYTYKNKEDVKRNKASWHLAFLSDIFYSEIQDIARRQYEKEEIKRDAHLIQNYISDSTMLNEKYSITLKKLPDRTFTSGRNLDYSNAYFCFIGHPGIGEAVMDIVFAEFVEPYRPLFHFTFLP